MALWTELIDPETLTGYAREAQADYEERRGTLARFLPNRDVADIAVRFFKGGTGLIDAARFRAYDAELEIGRRPQARRVMVELPALGMNVPVSEYEQLRLRSGNNVSDEQALATIQASARDVVRAVSDAMEKLRGTVLATGKATVDQENFKVDDDFGRPAEHQYTAPELWADPSVSRLETLSTMAETYEDTTGEALGCNLMSRRVFRELVKGDEFQTQLVNGGARLPSEVEVNSIITGAGLAPIEIYDRRVSVNGVMTRALPDTLVLGLPEPVDVNDYQGTDLGATFWGRTLTSTDPDWGIEVTDQPGIVTGLYKNPKPPQGIELLADAIGMPVLANADRSIAVKVL